MVYVGRCEETTQFFISLVYFFSVLFLIFMYFYTNIINLSYLDFKAWFILIKTYYIGEGIKMDFWAGFV